MLFKINVKTNKAIPAAKIERYSSESRGTSPMLTCTIYVVIVCTDSKGLNVSFGTCPAATATIIVSPTALEIAKITDTIIPDDAAGIITRKAVCNLVAPMPYEASRSDFGTAQCRDDL